MPHLIRRRWAASAIAISAALLVCLLTATTAFAERRALLIGASEYQRAEKLMGPKNDVLLLRSALIRQGFDPGNIVVLADGGEHRGLRELGVACANGVGDACPTYANILDNFARLSEKAAPGDLVYVHFSGHGMKLPESAPGMEPDGFDEAIFPVDFGEWDPAERAVRNTITDDQIAAFARSLVAKHVGLFMIIDACDTLPDRDYAVLSSADPEQSANRGADPLSAHIQIEDYGELDPALPYEGPADPRKPLLVESTGETTLVIFNASKYGQPAIERNFRGHGSARADRIGMLSYALQKAMNENVGNDAGHFTYKALAARVLEIYAENGITTYGPNFFTYGRPVEDLTLFE